MNVCKFTPKRVNQEAQKGQPGFYRLGHIIDGRFHTGYIGRSDTCIQTRLANHPQQRWYTHFVVRPTDTKKEAYRLESLFYHLEQQVTNKRHPACPDGTSLECPYCKFENRVSNKKENNQISNNVA